MPNYYDSAGKKLTGSGLKKYLKALAQAQKTGKPYTGKQYYTADQFPGMYNGYSLGIVQQLGKLRAELGEAPAAYRAQTDDELMAQANASADTDYNSAKTQATNEYNMQNQALQAQLAALDPTYTAQVNAANKATQQNVDSLTGSMLSRGLGRSSYAGALQNVIQQSGANAVNTIMADKAAKQNDINGQISTLGSNYGSTLATLANTRDSAAKAAFSTLKQQDYQKGLDTSAARTAYLLQLLSQKKKVSSGNRRTTSTKTTNTNNNNSSNSGNGFFDVLGNWINGLF